MIYASVILLIVFYKLIHLNFLNFILLGTFIFAISFKSLIQLYALSLTMVGFNFTADLSSAFKVSVVFIATFIAGYLFFHKNNRSINTINKKKCTNRQFSWLHTYSLIFVGSVLTLYGLYGVSWYQGNRIGGTATVGGLARMLFSLLSFSFIIFCYRFKENSFQKISRNSVNIILFLVFSFVVLNLAGLRGWALIGLIILLKRYFAKINFTAKFFLILFLLALVPLKSILSGHNQILNIGAKGDFVEVTATLIGMKENGFMLNLSSISYYAFQPIPQSFRNSVGLLTASEEILSYAIPDFLTLNMGFNVSTFHIGFAAFGYASLPVIFLLGRFYATVIDRSFNCIDPYKSTLYLYLAMSCLNLGTIKYLLTYCIFYGFVYLAIKVSNKGITINTGNKSLVC